MRVTLDIGAAVSGRIALAGRTVELDAVRAAYIRPHDTAALHATFAAMQRAGRVDDLLLAWCDLTSALVLNPPASQAVNSSKPYQSQRIETLGFATPATLVTTDPAAVQAFWDRHGRVIYKSVAPPEAASAA